MSESFDTEFLRQMSHNQKYASRDKTGQSYGLISDHGLGLSLH